MDCLVRRTKLRPADTIGAAHTTVSLEPHANIRLDSRGVRIADPSACLLRASNPVLFDFTYAFPERWRRPAHRAIHRNIEGNPTPAHQDFQIDVAVSVRLARAESNEDQPGGVPSGNKHGPQKDCHVVAIARPQFQHPPSAVQQFHTKDIPRIPDVASHPVEQRPNLSDSVFGPNTIAAKDLNCLLADIEVLCPVLNQPSDQAGSDERPRCPFGDSVDSNARYDESTA